MNEFAYAAEGHGRELLLHCYGLIAEIVTFPPDCFPPFGLPLMMDAAPEMNTCH